MAENRKYYYLKLKDTFYDDDCIKLIKNMKDGAVYVNILLQLYLKALKFNGYLWLNEDVPYTVQTLSIVLGSEVGTVQRAIDIFTQMGLMEYTVDGTYYMTNIQLFIGKSSTEGERKRAARAKLDAKKNSGMSIVDKCPTDTRDICPPELEKESEQDISLEIERKKDVLGTFQNVYLKCEELEQIKKEFPNKWSGMIDHLSKYMKSTGKEYDNHYATLLYWAEQDRNKGNYQSDYTCKEGESL